ncbi:MAG: 23S rRNA (pseudouridine(1915)-N(3))-methyltransferase RlmH [Zetaproteobacteria bacterium]|nr:MAG: 23S rRNA (pseudouridine(1915)-N(3))-methyltransferase RlmH [Zetaproteobacteria bacterium]
MRIRLLAVGKGRPDLAAFEADFLRRLRAFAEVHIVELPEGRARHATQLRQQEARGILRAATEGFVLFDERGDAVSSRDWARMFSSLAGNARLDFVIGGASGVDATVRQRAGRCWSLSRLTLPHQLVRILVLEQCYRAFTMLRGHPYHRA